MGYTFTNYLEEENLDMMNLSKNFTLGEMCRTNTGLDNIPDTWSSKSLFFLCQFILQPIRDKFGPIQVTSGFRDITVNREVGGSRNSQHTRGEAADIRSPEVRLYDLYLWIVDNVNYGQVIIYPDRLFIHASMPRLLKEKEELVCLRGEYTKWEKGQTIKSN